MDAGLLERDVELGALKARLAEASAGHGRFVLVQGPPGIGKTSLLRALRAEARAADTRWLAARGSEREGSFAFGVVRQLFEPVVAGAPPERFAGSAGLARAVLTEPQTTGAAADGLFSVLHGLFWLVSNLADEQPLVMCIDDLQWSDAASLRFLEHLAVRVAELRVLVVLAARSGEAGLTIGGLVEQPDVEELHPAALGPHAVARLTRAALGADVDDPLCAAVRQATGGNPFLVRELLGELRRSGGGVDDVVGLAPPAVVRSLAVRLGRLPAAALALARAVAILGDPAELPEAARLAGLDPGEAAEAAEVLAGADVFERGRPLRFVHPVVCSSVHEGIPAGDRNELHLRAARLLAENPGRATAAAAHALSADPRGEAWIVEVLRRAAADARGRGAPESAATYLRRALLEPPPEDHRPLVLMELAEVAYLAGDEDALDCAQRALATTSDPSVRVAAAIQAGHVLSLSNRIPEASALVTRAATAPGVEPGLRQMAEALALAWSVVDVATRRSVLDAADSAVSRALELDDEAPPVLAALAALVGALDGATAEQTAALVSRAYAGGRLLDEVGSGAPFPHFATFGALAAGRWALAERCANETMANGVVRGSVIGTFMAFGERAGSRLRRGDVRGAESDATAALEGADHGGATLILRPFATSVLARVLIEQARLDEAEATIESLPVASRDPGLLTAVQWYEVRARLRMQQGRYVDAVADLGACSEWDREWRASNGTWTAWRTLSAEAYAALGRREAASAIASEALELASRFGSDALVGAALRALAFADEPADRVDRLRAAIECLESGDALLEAAHARGELGDALAAVGTSQEATATLTDALARAEEMGAVLVASRARARLVALGARPRRRAVSGAAALTAAERRVAELAAAGTSNREIAQALFLTLKTVENHLTSVYRKLGIRSRTQLAESLGGVGTGA